MSGRGGVIPEPHNHHRNRWDGVVPPECLTSHLHWEPAGAPLYHDIDASKVFGVGPGMAFVNTLIHRSYGGVGTTVGLVPCAVGGTEIKDWERGERLYEDMVRRARARAVRYVILFIDCFDLTSYIQDSLKDLAPDIK